jgi:hypothetical protein
MNARANKRTRPVPTALATFLLLLAVLPIATGSGATVAKVRACKNVVVQFEPEGSGGAAKIKAKHIKCSPARKVIRKCIKGTLKPGWSGTFANNRFKLRRNRKRIKYLPVGGGGCIPLDRARAAAPAPPAGARRIERYKPNLDDVDGKDRVYVYNLPKAGVPTTWFETWTKNSGTWKRRQQKLVNEIPSADPGAGLVESWLSDLNRDGRRELAVRDFFTPSYGETLSIFRQKSKHSPRLKSLQVIAGDRVAVKEKGRGEPAIISAYRKANHSPDSLEHHEKWKWSSSAKKWRCRQDCAPLP